MNRPGSFRLLWYYLLVIVFAVPAVTGVAAWWTALTFRAELFEEAKNYATDVAYNVYHRVEKDFLVPIMDRGEYIDLLNDHAQREQLREIVLDSTHKHRVEKLYFFNTDGTITYSTVEDHIGASMPHGNVYFETALRGEVASVVRRRDNPLDISDVATGEELLETYVPVRLKDETEEGSVIGVVEVYQDMTGLNEAVRKSGLRVALVAFVSMGVLGGFFALITLKADRIIRQRETEILDSNSALQALSTDLERQVAERTRQLIQQEKLASLGTLAAGVAHEINNPLATISTCAEGSLKRLEEPAPGPDELQVVRRYLDLIRQVVFQCKNITKNLLDFSRQRRSTEFEPIEFESLINQSLELLTIGNNAQSIDVERDLCGPIDGVEGDPIQIRQIIHNLLSNSFDAVRDLASPRILLRTRSTGDTAVLECCDNGPGIPNADRDKVFEPFYSTKAAGEGTGLGLAVCYSIAQQHSGRLELLSPDGRADGTHNGGEWSTCFRLTLPRRRTATAVQRAGRIRN